jgi:hypothetical protein
MIDGGRFGYIARSDEFAIDSSIAKSLVNVSEQKKQLKNVPSGKSRLSKMTVA